MNVLTGTDGVTSIPATRTLTSAGLDFLAAGVRKGDILHVEEPDPVSPAPNKTGDNNRYFVTGVAQHVLTVQKDWPVGGLTGLDFRIQRTIQQFSGEVDFELTRRIDREAHWHLFTPRPWWVLDQLTPADRNLYGESKLLTRCTGADGVTSLPANRTLTSAGTDFQALGVRTLDNLLLPSGADAGSYSLVQVTQHGLKVDRNWPVGSLTAQAFTVRGPSHKYTPFGVHVPFYVKLDPPKDLLSKYGMDTPRDALFVMSIPLLDDLGLVPKIGDRFDVWSERKFQQFEVLTITKEDTFNNAILSTHSLHYIGSAMKTRYRVD